MKFKDLILTFFYVYICGVITLSVLALIYFVLVPILYSIGLIEPKPDLDTLMYMIEGNLKFPLQWQFIIIGSGLPLFFYLRGKFIKKFEKKKK